jgi:TusA-related sulfurtransferase
VEGRAGDKDKMTVVAVLREAKNLKEGQILELITTFFS